MDAARVLFHDPSRSQFVIVTIPTLMAAAESARLAASLRSEGIPLATLVINQVMTRLRPHALLPPRLHCRRRGCMRACAFAADVLGPVSR